MCPVPNLGCLDCHVVDGDEGVTLCSFHAAAEDMREALEQIAECMEEHRNKEGDYDWLSDKSSDGILGKARAALALAAKGEGR